MVKENLSRRCQASLTEFATHALAPLGQKPAAHHQLLIDHLEAITRRDIQRLMVFMPPGSAKSTYASVLFPAWYMASNPHQNIIAASHTADLAEAFSKRVLRTIADNEDVLGYKNLNEAANLWLTDNGCQYKSAGVGGAVTGFRANLGLVDDPVKSRADADSPTYREKAYNWYRSDFKTRLVPGAAVVVIQCMTGDTPVMMANGAEKPLRDIRPGDAVATYRDGKLSDSKVSNWINHGCDRVYEIKMTSGKVVRANERHPFLVCVDGEPKWIKLRDLRPGHEIFRVSGVNGKAKPASMKDAISRLFAEATALTITLKSVGLMAFGHLQLIQNLCVLPVSSIDMVLQPKNMMNCTQSKAVCVRSVSSRPVKMFEPIGAGNCASITATHQEWFVRFFAMIATLRQAISRVQKSQKILRNTSDFTLDCVKEISPAGNEDVFDIEVAETENFIANGLVSHNTRWHEDDLAGRLLQDDPNGWEILKLPAFAIPGEPDALGRKPGEPLWSDDNYGYGAELFKIKKESEQGAGERDFFSLYQQSPRPLSGSIFKTEKISVLEAPPAGSTLVRAWDLASTAETGGRDPDWTCGGLFGRTPQGAFFVADMVRFRGGPDEVEATIVATASRDGRGIQISLPQDPGQAGASQVKYFARRLMGYKLHTSRETGDKATRAMPLASQVNVGNVSIVKAAWNRHLIEEMAAFPGGSHDDQVDCLSRGFDLLSGAGSALERARMLTQRVA